MSYSFDALSPADFEDLTRDLIGRHLSVRFEAFGPGPDGGMDGRHAGGGTTILQAKHYRLSDFASLARTMTRERRAIDALSPERYLLATSRPLSPGNKDALAAIIGTSLRSTGDIFGEGDLNHLLRTYPEIEKAHVKLWLSSTAILERVLHAATHNFTKLTERDIRAKLKVYAENPSFKSGRDILEKQRVLIISGPPGVGKTTLAEMLCYAYLGDQWELVVIRSLEEGFAQIDDSRRQIFLFDDFLGRIALDERALSNQDSDLARFISRVRRTPTARFVLTTRAYIYEQAKLLSEALSDTKLNVSRYLLDVGIYTRRIRARILYNHLIVTGVPEAHIAALIEAGAIKTIVDHDHYNPRIIEWMTEPDRLDTIASEDYPAEFIEILDHPERIWDKAFRTHIPRRCQHLLIAMFLCSEFGAEIDDVQEVFAGIHPVLCRRYGIASGPKDFEDALRTLEGSFVAIANGTVNYVNPSVRDYLARYLNDVPLLIAIAAGVPTFQAASHLQDHFKTQKDRSTAEVAAFAGSFTGLCGLALARDIWKRQRHDRSSLRLYELAYVDRIELLLEWWRASGNQIFLRGAETIASTKAFRSWSDGRKLPLLLSRLRGKRNMKTLTDALEKSLAALITNSPDPDDIDRVLSAAEPLQATLPATLFSAIDEAIMSMIADLPDNLGHIDSESTLEDWSDRVKKLGRRVGASEAMIDAAEAAILCRLDEVRETEATPSSASFTGSDDEDDDDQFDDVELANLFAPLAHSGDEV